MFPILRIGPLQLQTHLLLTLAAALLVGVGAWLRSRRRFPEVNAAEVIDITFYLFCGVALGALVGATLPYLLMVPFGRPLPPYWYMGWQNWFGAVTGGVLAGALYCRKHRRPFGWSLDLFAPLLPLVLAVVRLGCLLAGDSYGKETTSWLAVYLPDMYGRWAMRYPSQPVDILIGLLMAGALFALERGLHAHRPGWYFDGWLFWLYVLVFCLQRFYLEFWRADTPPLFGPFSWNHLYCVIGICLALGAMASGGQDGWGRPSRKRGWHDRG
jgi:phosphatidylglycerol:prolipoprotein diacylglycerol transferase